MLVKSSFCALCVMLLFDRLKDFIRQALNALHVFGFGQELGFLEDLNPGNQLDGGGPI